MPLERQELIQAVPDPDVLLAMPVEELGMVLLRLLALSCNRKK